MREIREPHVRHCHRNVRAQRRREQHGAQHPDVHATGGRQRPGHEQQGVAGQEGEHHQTGLAEDDQEQDRVDPGAVLGRESRQMHVEVQDDVDECGEEFHCRSAKNADTR